MWLLNFLPNFVIHLMLLAGVLGIVASFVFRLVPFFAKYHLIILAISLTLTIIAVWYEGAIAKDAQYQAAIQEMQVKIAESEKKAAEANAKIEYIFIDRVQRIKDVQVVVKEKLKTVAVNIDDQCRITHDVVDIHNTSARNKR